MAPPKAGSAPIQCAFGFPSADDSIIFDIGTSAIIHAEVTLARRLGQRASVCRFRSRGLADARSRAALAGTFATWGSYKGSGLAIVVQLLGILAGSPRIPPERAGFGFFVIAMRPDLMGPDKVFAQRVRVRRRSAVRAACARRPGSHAVIVHASSGSGGWRKMRSIFLTFSSPS